MRRNVFLCGGLALGLALLLWTSSASAQMSGMGSRSGAQKKAAGKAAPGEVSGMRSRSSIGSGARRRRGPLRHGCRPRWWGWRHVGHGGPGRAWGAASGHGRYGRTARARRAAGHVEHGAEHGHVWQFRRDVRRCEDAEIWQPVAGLHVGKRRDVEHGNAPRSWRRSDGWATDDYDRSHRPTGPPGPVERNVRDGRRGYALRPHPRVAGCSKTGFPQGCSRRSGCKAERDAGREAYLARTPQRRTSGPTQQMGLLQRPGMCNKERQWSIDRGSVEGIRPGRVV